MELKFHFPPRGYSSADSPALWKLRRSTHLTAFAATSLSQTAYKDFARQGLDGQVQLSPALKEAVQCLEPSSQFLDVANLSVLLRGTAPKKSPSLISFPPLPLSTAAVKGSRFFCLRHPRPCLRVFVVQAPKRNTRPLRRPIGQPASQKKARVGLRARFAHEEGGHAAALRIQRLLRLR